tara:strand:+ start:1007 stop:1585 length:579 start_codon:yes stop_codon:yes gene_type:complete
MAIGDTLEYVGSATGTGSSNSIIFSGLPNTSDSFFITGICSTSATGVSSLGMRFNSDSNSYYTKYQMGSTQGANLTFSASGSYATYGDMGQMPGTSVNVGVGKSFFQIEIWSLSKSSISPGSPSFMSRNGGIGGSNTDSQNRWLAGSYSYSNSGGSALAPSGTDVSSVQLFIVGSGNFPTSTRFSLYRRPTT